MQYLILSDIHANLDALEAVLDAAPAVPIWFLGDAVGYFPDCCEVVDRLRELQTHRLQIWLKGNHEFAVHLAERELLTVRGDLRPMFHHTAERLGHERVDFLKARPEGPLLAPDEPRISLVHGSPHDPLNHYLRGTYAAYMAAKQCTTPLCLVGHTHHPKKLSSLRPASRDDWDEQGLEVVPDRQTFRFSFDGMTFLNPGSVGQPRDGYVGLPGHAYAAYALLDTVACTFTVHRVAYDPSGLFERTRRWLNGVLDEATVERLCQRLLLAQ